MAFTSKGKTCMKKIMAERSAGIKKRKRASYDAASANNTGMKKARTTSVQEVAVQPQEEADLEEGLLTVPLLKHQRIALFWMQNREQASSEDVRGGVLADDQGLGKTISTIALILKKRAPKSVESDDLRGGTLVVCPTSVLRQWAGELQTKVSKAANLTFTVHHGPKRSKVADDIAKFDVVLTTYSILAIENPTPKSFREMGLGCFYSKKLKVEACEEGYLESSKSRSDGNGAKAKKRKGALSQITWFRVVLDEAQCIRNGSTSTARAAWGLDTARRWCLSGTPLQNKIHDLYSYLRFFQHKPYEIYEHFHNEIVCHSEMNKKKAYTEVRRVLKDILLRRTKITFINGEPILNLPPRIVDLEEVDFYPEEKAFYKKLEKDLEERLLEFVSKQRMVSQFLKWMVELLRLRQACDHPSLVTRCKTKENSLKASPRQALYDACHDAVRELAVLSCSHACCKDCVGGDVCPVCDKIVVGEDHLEVHSHKMKREEPDRSEWVSSSKIDAAIRKLQAMPVGEKALVFSQWCGMLDVLEIPLKKLGVCYRRLDGTMSVAARDSAVQDFKSGLRPRYEVPSLLCVVLLLKFLHRRLQINYCVNAELKTTHPSLLDLFLTCLYSNLVLWHNVLVFSQIIKTAACFRNFGLQAAQQRRLPACPARVCLGMLAVGAVSVGILSSGFHSRSVCGTWFPLLQCDHNVTQSCQSWAEFGGSLSCPAPGCMVEPNCGGSSH